MEEKDINVNEESLKENEQKENNKEEIKTETNVLIHYMIQLLIIKLNFLQVIKKLEELVISLCLV